MVPCFNAERWLAAAIDSALAQTWPHVEVIVVDDGSADGSLPIARGFGDRIRVLTGPNEGPSAARNKGLAAARGRWIQLLDSDDLLLPRKVEACVRAASAQEEIPFTRLLPFGAPAPARGARLARRIRAARPRFDPDRPVVTALTFEIQTSQPLFPAALLKRVGGFRPELRWLEDIDLNLRLVLAGARYVPVDEPLVLLRDHADPGRQRLAPGAAVGRLQGEQRMIDAVRDAGQWTPELAAIFADRLAYAARQALIADQVEPAREALALAHALSPRPRPTAVPLYNAAASWVGLERLERLLGWVRPT